MTVNLWNPRMVLKYFAVSAIGIVLFLGEICIARCPEVLDGTTIRNLALSGEAEIGSGKLILDEGSEEKNIEVRGKLMGAKLDLLKGTLIKQKDTDPKTVSMCTYKVHDKENKRQMEIHIKAED